MLTLTAARVFVRYLQAAALTDVSKLRLQAVILIGAGGSGKGYVGRKWMKYMPGAPSTGIDFDKPNWEKLWDRKLNEQEKSQTNLGFEKALKSLESKGIHMEPVEGGTKGSLPFRLYTYDDVGGQALVPEKDWAEKLPPEVYDQVKGLKDVVFGAPVHEVPSYWRQVNPDLYKEELAGYVETEPGYVHSMSSDMAKSYLAAILESGDPLFIDGTGKDLKKMLKQVAEVKSHGYKTSLVFVYVPLTVNQIRNASRPRKVASRIVTKQWGQIATTYVGLKSMVNKAKVVINRNDSADITVYRKMRDVIENHVRRTSSYDSLYDLIKAEAPQELGEWGALLKGG